MIKVTKTKFTNAAIIIGVLMLLVLPACAAAPVVDSTTPNSGMNNTLVLVNNIAGSNFPDQNNASVYLNRTGQTDFYATSVLVDSSNQIQCILDLTQKPLFGQWNVVVKNISSQEIGVGINNFSVNNPAPTLTDITPTSGYINSTPLVFTVSGTNFLPGAKVNLTNPLYSNLTSTISSNSGGTITGTFNLATATNGTWYVNVTNPDGLVPTEIKTFTIYWPPPIISGFTPSLSTNNKYESLTINGDNFRSDSIAYLNKTGYPDISLSSMPSPEPTQMNPQFNLNGVPVGSWNVVVKNSDGPSATATDKFWIFYPASPSVANITPSTGLNTTSISGVLIGGSGFQPGATVNLTQSGINIQADPVVVNNQSYITCTLPITGAATGAWNIKVINNDTQFNPSSPTFTITAPPAPTASFTTTSTPGPAPLNVQFNDTSINDPKAWNWSFGDNQYFNTTDSALRNKTHSYAVGTWSARLLVSNDYGSSTSAVQTITVSPPPTANFTYTPENGVAPLRVFFSDTSVTGISSRLWRFGIDEYTSTNQTPDFTYYNPGTYTVNLTVTNITGTSSIEKSIIVTLPPVAPVTNFTGSPRSGTTTSLSVQFNDTSTGTGITGYQWIFSDSPGTILTTPNLTRSFSPGIYNVNHSATNGAGTIWKNETGYITVTAPVDPPVANFFANKTSGMAPLNDVQFTDTSTGTAITGYQWILSDSPGTIFNTQNLLHSFPIPGSYNVNHSVTNSTGTTVWKNETGYITVTSAPVPPVAGFTASDDHGFVPLTVTFTDTSVTGISSWNWNFGDGVTSTLQTPPPHLYSSVQNYTVNLTVTNTSGTNTTSKTIVATNQPVSNFTATPTTGNMPLLVNFTDLSTGTPTSWSWDFGDGNNSTEKNPGHTYTSPGVYSVSLMTANAGGSGIPLGKIGYITVAPVASFNATPTQGNVPLTVQFTDTSMGAPTSWSWDFGDYNTSSQPNPSHTYAAQGVYTVRLEVMKAGVTNTSERINLINATQPKPVAGFSGYPYNGTAKETVFHFVDQSTNNPTSWHWSFGDGTTSDIQNPTHIYNSSGNKYVSLTASNIGGSDTAYGAGPIVVKNPPPVASFTGTPTLGSVPLKVQFTDTSSNIPTNWIWIFGDGEFDLINRNPVHTYNKAGSYNVTLTVWDETSGLPSNSTTRRAYITATNTPLAGFTANPVAGAAPLVVRFTDQSQGKPFRFYWTFGDGAYSYEKDPTHSYLRPGSYTVTETVRNIAGSNTVVKQNLINVTTLPQAGFIVNATSGIEPTTIQFTDTSTGIPSPNSWSWDFGDGKTSAVKNPVNTYLSAGVYSVRLTVSNGVNSSTVTKPNLITISTRTGAEFRADPAEGDVPLMIQFTDLSTGNPIRYAWNFDDGRYATSNERNPVYTYTKPGSYNVTLTITTSDRVTSTVTHQVVLTGIPVASLKANPTTGSNPLTVQFTDTSSNNPTEWVWSFGDGAFGSVKNPVHTYNSAGKFTVTLFVRNEYGESIQPYSELINVKQFP